MPPAVLATVADLLPRESVLLAFYAAGGAFGGIVAAAHVAEDARPSVWRVVRGVIVGAGLGFAGGAFGLYKLGSEPADFFLTIFGCFGLGAMGLPVFQKLLKGAINKGTLP